MTALAGVFLSSSRWPGVRPNETAERILVQTAEAISKVDGIHTRTAGAASKIKGMLA